MATKQREKGRPAGLWQAITHPTSFAFAFFLSLAALFLLCYTLNALYMPKAFVADGLGSLLDFQKTPFLEYINPLKSSGHFRPVNRLVFAIVFSITGDNIHWIGPILIGFNFLLSLAVYYIATKISGRFFVGFCVACCFLVSHCAYYQVMETYGFMEGFALLFSICMLYQLYRYIHEETAHRSFYWAVVFYLLASLTHERYLVLFPLFLVAIVLRNILYKGTWKTRQQITKLLCCTAAFGLLMLVRALLLGSSAMSGTGGTNIVETFSIARTLRTMAMQVLQLLGISFGPSYLTGTTHEYFTGFDWALVAFYIACVLAIFLWSFVVFIRQPPIRKRMAASVLLFGCFIGGCIVSSSTTIRLEIRWVYVSQTAFLLLVAYLVGILFQYGGLKNVKWKPLLLAVPLIFSLSFGCVETLYRRSWPNLYIADWVLSANDLYETVVVPYGGELEDREVIFVSESTPAAALGDLTLEMKEYFLQFGLSPAVRVVNSYFSLSPEDLAGSAVIIKMQNDHHPYRLTDLTGVPLDVVPEVGEVWAAQGIDGDGWTSTNFSFRTFTGSRGTITLDCISSSAQPGNEATVWVNGKATVFAVDSLYPSFTVQAPPFSAVDVEVTCNYSLVTPPDTRQQSLLVLDILVT